MHRRSLVVLSVAAVVSTATVAGGPPAGASPQAASRHATHVAGPNGASTGSAESRPNWLVRHGQRPASVDAAARRFAPAATSTAARLDPAAAGLHAARNGTVQVTVRGAASSVRERVGALGGRVVVSAAGSSVVVVRKSRLATLANAAGVQRVSTVDRPYALDGPPAGQPSQAVAASGADTWQTAGTTGAGAKVAIVDLGFGSDQSEYDAEVSAGHLGANTQLTNVDCTDSDNNPTPYEDPHGLAVAEVAQQQAPGAQLFLYCVSTQEGVSEAIHDMLAQGITIASSSVGWFQDARGDGSGPSGSVAAAVRYARQHGILWINSAGNEVPEHYSGTLADADKDGYLDIGGKYSPTGSTESNFYLTAPGSTAAPTSLAFIFQWDEWPAATHRLTLLAYGVQCHTGLGDGSGNGTTDGQLDGCNGTYINDQNPVSVGSQSGDQPTLGLDTADPDTGDFANTLPYPQVWEVLVGFDTSFIPGLRYDLFGEGDTYGPSSLSCPTSDSEGNCIFSTAAKNGSVVSPANSPYALGVGAADTGADGTTKGALEYFSSQGPTIDRRVKPDITGWDGVSSYVSEFSDGFYGTSAAAPSVAGAAALVQSANPSLDAAQIQYFLEQRASSGTPLNPPNNAYGHGLLTLGDAPPQPTTSDYGLPAATKYAGLPAPQRILGGRVLGAGGTASVTVPSSVPADATAVAINLSGTSAAGDSYLSVYPGTTYTGTANVNVSKADPASAAFTVVALPADGSRVITVRNGAANVKAYVDLVGYFAPDGTSGYTALPTAKRVLNQKIGLNRYVTVRPAVGAGATAAVVDLAVLSPTGTGYFTATAGPDCSTPTSALTYKHYSRNNLAFVPLNSDGTFCLGVHGAAAATAVVDVVGYFGDGGAGYVALPTGQRIIDTRYDKGNNGGQRSTAPLAANTSAIFYEANVGDVPAGATGLLTSVTELSSTGSGYLQLFPGSVRPSTATSTVSFTKGRVVPNGAVAPLSTTHQLGVYNSAGTTHVVIDMFGYFI